jgi:hypothetical protein
MDSARGTPFFWTERVPTRLWVFHRSRQQPVSSMGPLCTADRATLGEERQAMCGPHVNACFVEPSSFESRPINRACGRYHQPCRPRERWRTPHAHHSGLSVPISAPYRPSVPFSRSRVVACEVENVLFSEELMVGAPGFEPGTPSPPDWCANRAALRSANGPRLRCRGASRKGRVIGRGGGLSAPGPGLPETRRFIQRDGRCQTITSACAARHGRQLLTPNHLIHRLCAKFCGE